MSWGCSECAWMFVPQGLPIGKSLDEMLQNFQDQRNKDFETHVCADHPRPQNPPNKR
jgi:hypothetical protein